MITARVPVARSAWALPAFTPVLPVFGALVLWLTAIRTVDVRQMTDLGLVSVLPPLAMVALLLLIASFCVTLRQTPTNQPVLLLHVVTLIFMLYGVTTVVEESTRFVIAWRHVGIAEYISRNGAVDPLLDAYHSWPGFFALTALLVAATGLEHGIDLAPWASLYFNLLYLGPLVVIFRSVTRDERVVWLGVWLFYLTNWIGQDYFAPQALNYFFHLTVLAVLLTWFRPRGAGSSTGFGWLDRLVAHFERDSDHQHGRREAHPMVAPRGGSDASLAQRRSLFTDAPPQAELTQTVEHGERGLRAGLLAVLVVLLISIVSSHQLTPFFLLFSVLALVMTGRCGLRGLPVLLGVLVGAWAIFPAHGFFDGHFTSLVADASGGDSMAANVTDRLQGSLEHLFIVRSRLVFTALVWGMAGLGMLKLLWMRRFDLSLALLAAVPFPIIVAQPYGGEMLLRVYLFVLPSMAFFGASLLLPRPDRPIRWLATGLTFGVCVALLAGFLFARYGNERMDYMTFNEVDAVERLYSMTPPVTVAYRRAHPGDEIQRPLLLAAGWNLPWRFRDYEGYDLASLESIIPSEQDLTDLQQIDVTPILKQMETHRQSGAYFILTRGEAAELEVLQGMPAGGLDRLREAMVRSGRFVIVYQNPDATIFKLAEPQPEPTLGESAEPAPAVVTETTDAS